MSEIKDLKSYSREEVFKSCMEYFQGDELASNVWIDKYCLKNYEGELLELNPNDMHRRLAREFARIEKKYENPLSEEQIYNYLKDFKYIIPQGSPMSGIGNDFQIQSLSNCFVVGNNKEDSYGSIMRVDEYLVQIFKRRGGVGVDISHLRAENMLVKNSAKSSTGSVSFAERYSNTTKEVGQNNRRGALMISMSSKHPDVEKFVGAKLDTTKLTGANISVKIDNAFMEALDEGKEYIQQYPIDSKSPEIIKSVDPKKIWDKLILNNWKSAEPGIIFEDTILNESNGKYYGDRFKEISTNPCFPASEYLLTENGYVKFGDLFDNKTNNKVLTDDRVTYNNVTEKEQVENWIINNDKDGLTTIRDASHVFLTQPMAEIVKIKTKRGFELKCTPDHYIATSVGMVEAKDLTKEHKILISKPDIKNSIVGLEPETAEEIAATLIGFITGDGTFDKKRNRAVICFWGEENLKMKDFVIKQIDKLYNIYGPRKNYPNKELSKYCISENKVANKFSITSAWLYKILDENFGFNKDNKFHVPEFITNNSRTNIGKFYLASFFYCDGSFQGCKEKGYSIRLAQSNEPLLVEIQRLLHSNGLIFNIYKRRDYRDCVIKGKSYRTKPQYELISSGGDSILNFAEYIGFFNTKNDIKIKNIDYNFRETYGMYTNIISIDKQESEPVYCIKEPITRSIIVNGLTSKRCGEIPLPEFDACRLILNNLYSFVENPFTKEAKFNFDKFIEVIRVAQRLNDDLVDLEIEQIDKILAKIETDPESEATKWVEKDLWTKIRKMNLDGRRTGLGITAEGDMLSSLNLIYGTKEATNFATEVHKIMALASYEESINLAKERGAFGVFDYEKEKEAVFVNRILDLKPELKEDWKKYGRRNLANLTISPAGTTSLMSQTSSGIEPCFKVSYKRRRKVMSEGQKVDFVDELGVKWEENYVFHHKFVEWYKINYLNNEGSFQDALKLLNSKSENELNELIELSPYHKATANDVDWIEKVRMQGCIQKYIDHSISVTVNVPKETTVETVDKIYRTAYKSGAKGCTIYRDTCRDGVLVSSNNKGKVEEKNNITDETHAKKRPKRLKANIVRFNNKNEKWVAIVGILDDKPYEIFTGLLEKFNIPSNIDEGFIVKVKEGENKRYDFEYITKENKKTVIVPSINFIFRKEYWNYAKLISSMLRHRMPLASAISVIENLTFDEEHINIWKNGVIRALKKFVKNGAEGGKCPKCGGVLIYSGGCVSCQTCGDSKCG